MVSLKVPGASTLTDCPIAFVRYACRGALLSLFDPSITMPRIISLSVQRSDEPASIQIPTNTAIVLVSKNMVCLPPRLRRCYPDFIDGDVQKLTARRPFVRTPSLTFRPTELA